MDDERRLLERAVRGDPSDRAAGWALVEAHERAGDRAAARRERARLWGDPVAWRALEGPRRGPSGTVEIVQRELAPGAVLLPGQVNGPVVVALQEALEALDPDDLATRWTVPVAAPPSGRTPAAVVGPAVVHVDLAGRAGLELVLRDRASGQELDRRACPLPGPELSLVGRLDAVVVLDRTRALTLETGRGRLGRVVSELVVKRAASLRFARDLLLESGGGVVKAWPLEGLAPRWTRAAGRHIAEGPPEVVLVAPADGRVAELEPEQGATRWSLPAQTNDLIVVSVDVVLLLEGRDIAAFSRQGADHRWTAALEGRPLAACAAEDAVCVVVERGARLELLVHDLRDGALRSAHRLAVELGGDRGDVALTPREAGVVALVRPRGYTNCSPVAFALRSTTSQRA